MQPSSAYPVLLFSYGTLQDKAVQLANFGRELNGQADRMPGYRLDWVEITDPDVLATSGKSHHPIVSPAARPTTAWPVWSSRSAKTNWQRRTAMKLPTTSVSPSPSHRA